jgi:predicted AlkP superfamily pyrophosphatase or phosphodiesterase
LFLLAFGLRPQLAVLFWLHWLGAANGCIENNPSHLTLVIFKRVAALPLLLPQLLRSFGSVPLISFLWLPSFGFLRLIRFSAGP